MTAVRRTVEAHLELVELLNEAMRVASVAETPKAGIVAVAKAVSPRHRLVTLHRVDVEADVRGLRRQIEDLAYKEPPPLALNALWLGLFDSEDDDGEDAIGFYVAGVAAYRPGDPDSLVSPAWLPKNRFLQSTTLAALKRAELRAAEKGPDDLAEVLAYAGRIGVAALLARFATSGLFPGLTRVVGFDSGDSVEVPVA